MARMTGAGFAQRETPEGADGSGSGRNGTRGSRDALGDTTTGQTFRRVQRAREPG